MHPLVLKTMNIFKITIIEDCAELVEVLFSSVIICVVFSSSGAD